MRPTILLSTLCLFALGGCGEDAGFLVRPVRVDQRLREKVVQADRGWYVGKIALVDVSGLIVNERVGWLSKGDNPVSLLAEKLDAAERDKAVKAVVLRINSPGGTVQASEAMYKCLERFRQRSGKPVVACITDMGASGGYYLACGAGKIICQPSSITGSVGVLIQTVSFAGTMELLGIKAEAISSGPLKTMGSPLRDVTDRERRLFQEIVTEFFDRFVAVVAAGRPGLSPAKVRALADGRVYTGRQALAAGLVDQLGDVQDAIDAAKQAAGIERAKVVMYHRPLGYRANVYSAATVPGTQINLINFQAGELMMLRRPMFLYLWSTDLRSASSPAAATPGGGTQ